LRLGGIQVDHIVAIDEAKAGLTIVEKGGEFHENCWKVINEKRKEGKKKETEKFTACSV